MKTTEILKRSYYALTIGLLFLFLSVSNVALGQEKREIVLQFDITEATVNDVDYSDTYTANKARIIIYKDSDGEKYLVNKWQNSESYGKLDLITDLIEEETPETYLTYTGFYNWHYANTYNDETGICTVRLQKLYVENDVVCVLQLLIEDDAGNVERYLEFTGSEIKLSESE